MKVFVKCSHCAQEISYKTNAYTRVEFAMQEGDQKLLNCKKCDHQSTFTADEFYAKPSKFAQLIAGLVFLIGTPLAFLFVSPIFSASKGHYVIYIVGGFLLVPVFIYAVINKQDQTRVSDFNRRKLKGRTHNI
ncbi:hypothetical protein [Aquimarina brevivitae]|uniref:Uncharacterized protein n=1 Tax=Aquimarina brevivitae TaxID=323412 RepID=A0A4V2F581_9FLAO|nr:hypothetical protein [Aquimarina brevivitae]RZS91899.1 hypothetical protein EV197_3003 [Aquimarina brevivitae]